MLSNAQQTHLQIPPEMSHHTRLNHEPRFWAKTTLRFIEVGFHIWGLARFHFSSQSSLSRGVVMRSQRLTSMCGPLAMVGLWAHRHRRLENSVFARSWNFMRGVRGGRKTPSQEVRHELTKLQCSWGCKFRFRSETLEHVAKTGARESEVMKFWEPKKNRFFSAPPLGHEVPKPHDFLGRAGRLAVAASSPRRALMTKHPDPPLTKERPLQS